MTYALKEKVEFIDQEASLSKPITDAIARDDSGLKHVKSSKYEAWAIYEASSKEITIKVLKNGEHSIQVGVEFDNGSKSINSNSVTSNTEWMSGAKFMSWSRGEKSWYNFVMNCPRGVNPCLYQIPDVEKFYGVTYKQMRSSPAIL